MKIILPTFTYAGFIVLLGVFYFHPVKCPFEKDISTASIENYSAVQEKYIYSIESAVVDEADVFGIAQVSGWIVKDNGNIYTPIEVEIVLISDDIAYRVSTYSVKRSDIFYLDSSESGGYLARFPSRQMVSGEYTIGFLINENKSTTVLRTDEKLIVERE